MESLDALNNNKMKTKRERIIPHKRGLLPVLSSSSTSASTSTSTSASSSTKTKNHNTINPSAVPAIIQLHRPVFSSLKGVTTEKEHDQDEKSERRRYTTGLDDDDESINKVVRIEFDSSQAPQPFLEPELLQKIMEARRQKKREERDDEEEEEEGGEATQEKRDIPAELNTEIQVRRRAAQTDYGTMAIRDRMNVRKRRR